MTILKRFWMKCLAFLPLASITVLIDNGTASAGRGRVKEALLSKIGHTLAQNNIHCGCIYVTKQPHGHRLRFFGIPKHLHQRLRNIWSANWP